VGLTIESNGPEVNIGEICKINALRENKVISAEAVGFRDNKVLLMPLGDMNGIGPGSKVVATRDYLSVGVGNALIGRVIDGMGRPIDGKGEIVTETTYPVENKPPHPLKRNRIKEPLPLGVKTIDGL